MLRASIYQVTRPLDPNIIISKNKRKKKQEPAGSVVLAPPVPFCSSIVSFRLLEQIRTYGTGNLYSVIVNQLVIFFFFFFSLSRRKFTTSLAGGWAVTWLLALVS